MGKKKKVKKEKKEDLPEEDEHTKDYLRAKKAIERLRKLFL